MARPDIEFLVTDRYGTIHTGGRTLSGFSATSLGSSYTFNTNKVNSALFGQALEVKELGSLYFDVTDDSLSFTGNSTILSSFAFGAYMWAPAANNIAWFTVIEHGKWHDSDLFFQTPAQLQISIFLQQRTASHYALMYAKSDGSEVDQNEHKVTLSEEYRSGWVHIAYVYDKNLNGGTLKGYVQGKINYTLSNYIFTAYSNGETGAYAIHTTKTSPFCTCIVVLYSSLYNFTHDLKGYTIVNIQGTFSSGISKLITTNVPVSSLFLSRWKERGLAREERGD